MGSDYLSRMAPKSRNGCAYPGGSAQTSKECGGLTQAGITYVAAAARVADVLTQDVLLAPIEASVIPLPHQIKALSTAKTRG
jgi:hypothetical protein